MGYRISKRKRKDGSEYWRLIWEKYEGDKRSQRHIPKSQWQTNGGFFEGMSFRAAQELARSLNDKDRLLQREEKRQKINEQIKLRERFASAFLPPTFIRGFEQDILVRELGRGNEAILKQNSTPSHWRLAKRIIADMKIEPWDWFDSKRVIYTEFEKRKMSPSYVQKVLRLMNLWGYYYCKKIGKPWEKVPRPTDHDLERIRDRYIENGGAEAESEPLTQVLLKKAKSSLTKEQNYEWLFVGCWFGLRPSEIDSLRNPMSPTSALERTGIGSWTITNDGNVDVLWVYQPKLSNINRMRRWKGIPVVEPEQKEALSIIKSIATRSKQDTDYRWKRPATKTIKGATDERVTAYGPRKGFYTLMKGRGYLTEDISRWLGHKDIRRTIQNYEDNRVVHYRKIPKAA